MRDVLTILHASDLQCGRPYVPRAGDAFVALAHRLAPDVIVVAGDLTQRAKVHEFAAAGDLLRRLPRVPLVLTPGNHDVPLYRIWERTLTPYKNWRAFVSKELDTVTRLEGATFVALNSSTPYAAIVGGRLEPSQVDFARRAFDEAPAADVRVLVVHHHFVPTPDGTGCVPLPGAAELIVSFEAMGVDLVLGGHVHRTHVHTSRRLVPGGGDGIPLVACGTTTSRRGRGEEAGLNSLNVVRVSAREIEVLPHLLPAGAERFAPRDPITFPRNGAAAALAKRGAV